MDLAQGGHLTHGMKLNFSGRWYPTIGYGVDPKTERIDYDRIAELAREHRPKLILAGASAYPRKIDFDRIAEIAREVGAVFFVDMAHIAGLVAAGLHPNPVPVADFVSTTTHKTLRGPRGGIVLCKSDWAKKLDSAVFPGLQGGPLDARHRGQGGLLRRGPPPRVQGLRRPGHRQRAGPGRGADPRRLPARLRGDRQPPDPDRHDLEGPDRQDRRGRPRPRRDHRQQEPDPLRHAQAARPQRHPHGDPRPDHPRPAARTPSARSPPGSSKVLAEPDDAALAERVRGEIREFARDYPVPADAGEALAVADR